MNCWDGGLEVYQTEIEHDGDDWCVPAPRIDHVSGSGQSSARSRCN